MTQRPRSAMPARKLARRARKATRTAARPARKLAQAGKPAEPAKPDPLDTFIVASARMLGLKIAKGWMPAVRANLAVTLRHAATVESLELPDDAEPAPVFRA